jgi:hypothetical protein
MMTLFEKRKTKNKTGKYAVATNPAFDLFGIEIDASLDQR